MIAVIFEAEPGTAGQAAYLELAESLRPLLADCEGFISVERFQSLSRPGRILSLSFWQDEEAVRRWREVEAHRAAQRAGRESIFVAYRLRVAQVIRDYGLHQRADAPEDSRIAHGA